MFGLLQQLKPKENHEFYLFSFNLLLLVRPFLFCWWTKTQTKCLGMGKTRIQKLTVTKLKFMQHPCCGSVISYTSTRTPSEPDWGAVVRPWIQDI